MSGKQKVQAACLSETRLDSVVLLLDEGCQLGILDIHMVEVHNQRC